LLFIEGEAFQRENRADHVLPEPLSLELCLRPDSAMDVETGVPLVENPLGLISDNHISRLATNKIPAFVAGRVDYPGLLRRRPGWSMIVRSGDCSC
jgi:hypothetical protein